MGPLRQVGVGKGECGVAARRALAAFAMLMGLASPAAHAASPRAVGPAALHAVDEELARAGPETHFRRPFRIDSSEGSGAAAGEAWGTLETPFPAFVQALSVPQHWCDILILHLNNKECRVAGPTITLKVARKWDQPADQAMPLRFGWHVDESTPQYLAMHLDAPEGPYGTSDYRITVEAVPSRDGRGSFMHFAYGYQVGMTGRIGMDLYFATLGRGKVGFSETGRDSSGASVHIDGMRGLMERNTMRYFLAVEAFLAVPAPAGATPAAVFDRRIVRWYDMTEQYPRQLHEPERQPFIELKKREFAATH